MVTIQLLLLVDHESEVIVSGTQLKLVLKLILMMNQQKQMQIAFKFLVTDSKQSIVPVEAIASYVKLWNEI